MNKIKRGFIWNLSKTDLENIVKTSTTLAQILRYYKLVVAGSNYKILKNKLNFENIDYSHIPQGRHANKNRFLGGVKGIPLESILIENSSYNRFHLKKKLIKNRLLINKCYECNQEPVWNNKKLVMVLDHINGINNDNRITNLRLLCPNCNSQTSTFAGRNVKKIGVLDFK